MRVDKVTMSTSGEARVPFLDHQLVDFAMALPLDMRLRSGVGKYLLKKAVRGLLKDAVIDRPKMGFNAPFAAWLRGPFGEFARSRLRASRLPLLDLTVAEELLDEHLSGRRDRSHEVWMLLNLVLWHERWIETGSAA